MCLSVDHISNGIRQRYAGSALMAISHVSLESRSYSWIQIADGWFRTGHGVFLMDIGGRKRRVSSGFVDKRYEAIIGRHFLVKSVGLIDVRLTVRLVKNMSHESFSPSFHIFQFFAGDVASRVGYETLSSRLDVEED